MIPSASAKLRHEKCLMLWGNTNLVHLSFFLYALLYLLKQIGQIKMRLLLILFFGCFQLAWGQEAISIPYLDPMTGKEIKLEAFVYEPKQPNGKTIVFSHGSTGGNKAVIAETIKFLRIGKIASDKGYRMVSFMRKGRGKSEGVFAEESGKCDRGNLGKEVDDAYPQLSQVATWVSKKYEVEKLIFMGHSRGGFLSSYFAGRHPERTMAAVSLAGVWSAFCEMSNGGFSRDMFSQSSQVFKNQFWAYFENDSYFAPDRFNDPQYEWFSAMAKSKGVVFNKYPQLDRKDGHETGTWRPDVWANDVFFWLDGVK
jgi:pimeloyl-ACP methyl ester carboxylesterase